MQQMWQIKEMMALAMLAVSAYTDIKEKNIYILPLIVPSVGAVAISVISYACSYGADESEILIYDILLPVLSGVILIVISKTGAAHIGMGDGYLMTALGLVIGIRYNLFVICLGFLIAAVYAGAVIISGKGGRRRRIPFAPFVMTAFMLLLFNEI